MSYRNGYDAAVARADALQLELTRLAAENTSLRNASALVTPSKPSRAVGVAVAAGSLLAVGAAVLLGVALTADSGRDKAQPPAAAAAVEPTAAPPMTLADLRTCALAIGSRPVIDIRGPDLEAVERTGARCRAQLHDAANAMPTHEQRFLVGAWADVEDQLANRISLIHEYYTTPGAALENYVTAPQLWSEYKRLLLSREAAISLVLAPGES